MPEQEQNRDNVFHERITILHEKGYRGFTISKIRKVWDGIEVTTRNHKGRTVTGRGETKEEACIKVIEGIDQALEVK
ncbi:hypothetical protein NC796_22815 [Aliifodinibius sp. S!AR15-10]|uniref:hypothetical protein n=1 Tax=Aliifodinibius sp. S!AR15-10 TaxID=2950437 RepID=UPI00285492A5|nr:hypothetical protein [Aliifodinibius sp. S!AR15-10]MDR8394004.1 hypothetical protein [Aliifodinibius sp. S!AR15-10]